MIKHKYEPSRIVPGLCGAKEVVRGTFGHFRCCGKAESHETHNQAHCQVCRHHFTPVEASCPRCGVYVPEAAEVIERRAA